MVIIARKPNQRRYEVAFAWGASFVIHAAILLILVGLVNLAKIPLVEVAVKESSSVRVKVISRSEQVIEAPLPETDLIPLDSAKGRQNRYTERETRLPPQNIGDERALEASRVKSTRSGASTGQNDSEPGSGESGVDALPNDIGPGTNQKQSNGGTIEGYAALLPKGDEILAYNDFVVDESIPIGDVLDINTTEYKYIGYLTAIRKAVELAFYSPRSALKNEPHVREKIESGTGAQFRGNSTALIVIEKSGLVSNVSIVDSSGQKTIDEQWVRILNLAAPFPPIPRSYEEDTFRVTYTLYYDFVFRENKRLRRFQF